MAPNGLKWAKNDPKWLKNDPKMTFWYLGDLPGTKKGPKMRKNDPKRPFVAPNDLKWAKNGPKMTQNGPKMAQKWPKNGEIAKKLQPAFFNFWRRGTVSEISVEKSSFLTIIRFFTPYGDSMRGFKRAYRVLYIANNINSFKLFIFGCTIVRTWQCFVWKN